MHKYLHTAKLKLLFNIVRNWCRSDRGTISVLATCPTDGRKVITRFVPLWGAGDNGNTCDFWRNRWHRIPFTSKIMSGFTVMMARTDCGIGVLSDEVGEDTDEVFVEKLPKLQNVTTSDFIADSSCCCLRSSIFRRFFSFRRCTRSCNSFSHAWGLVVDVVDLEVILLSTEAAAAKTIGTVVILTTSAGLTRSMTSKAHLSNLHWVDWCSIVRNSRRQTVWE